MNYACLMVKIFRGSRLSGNIYVCVCACVHVYICVYMYIQHLCIYDACFAILNLYIYIYNLLDDYLNAVQPPKACLLH